MGFDPKKVQSENVDRWSSLIAHAVADGDVSAQAANTTGPLFYNLASQNSFSRGTENEYDKLVQGKRTVAGAAEIAPPPSSFKGLSRFGR